MQPRLNISYPGDRLPSDEFHSLDTAREIPAVPKESSYSGTLGWENRLPQPQKIPLDMSNEEPYWARPPKPPIDIEKLTGRACIIGMAAVTFAFGMAVLVIFAIKVVQFSMTVTLK
jgi:hypothetical protein